MNPDTADLGGDNEVEGDDFGNDEEDPRGQADIEVRKKRNLYKLTDQTT